MYWLLFYCGCRNFNEFCKVIAEIVGKRLSFITQGHRHANLLDEATLSNALAMAEQEILSAKRLKFKKEKKWRDENFNHKAGVYALFDETDKKIYFGETDNLNKRMNALNRTVNHSFRKQFGFKNYGGIKIFKKIYTRS